MRDHFDTETSELTDVGGAYAWPRDGVEAVQFLGRSFSVASSTAWIDILSAHAGSPFSYVVTPNVDHMVQLKARPELCEAYDNARYHICDSRILETLAARRAITLRALPGSDITRSLVEAAAVSTARIAVLGPSLADFEVLTQRYPSADLVHIDAPMMNRGSDEWRDTLQRVEGTDFDILLICISFPKQELFALDLKRRTKAKGIGLCVGASIDFLTGRQKRAPKFIQSLRMEWAYRLLSNPMRLWKRYLVDGPKIFRIYLRDGRKPS